MSAAALDSVLDAYDEGGRALRGKVGALVVTHRCTERRSSRETAPKALVTGRPVSESPGVWRNADWITISDRGTVVLHCRPDTTVHWQGVRVGSADIHEIVDALPEVKEV